MSDPVATTPAPRGGHIAYAHRPGAAPTVVFLCGYASNMDGTKARHLERRAAAAGRAYLRFDYQGHGRSSGRFEDGTIGAWTEDALAAIEIVDGPLVLVGSSMGGWIMLNVALAAPDRVAGLLGIAAAPDFTETWPARHPGAHATLAADGRVEIPSAYGDEPLVVTRRFLDEGRRHLRLAAPIPLDCPVRLVHGLDDPDVPWRTSLALAEALASTDVAVTLVKGGGHRLSAPADLDHVDATLDDLLARVG